MTSKPTISYWVIAVLGLIWNLMGCLNFITQTNPDAVAAMPDAYQMLIASRPTWATAGFAVAVFGGAVGCILLLLRRRVAEPVFVLALLGVIVTLFHALMVVGFASASLISTGTSVLVAAILLWVARSAKAKGWLR